MSRRKLWTRAMIVAATTWLAVDYATGAITTSQPAAKPAAASPAPNPIQPIVKRMQEAQSRLKQGDTGAETRTIQQEVVRDLDKLIDAASRQSGSNQGSGKSSQDQSQRSDQQSQQQQGQQGKQGQQAGSQATNSGAIPGKNGGTRPRQLVLKKPGATDRSTLAREVWGHLPPAVCEHVRVDFSETVLPAYDELVRQYFEALLEATPGRRGNAPASSGPAQPQQLPTPAGSLPK